MGGLAISLGVGRRRKGGLAYLYNSAALASVRTAITNRATTPVRIICAGDSIVEGYNVKTIGSRWPDRLKIRCNARWPTTGVVNMALSNYIPVWFWNGAANSYLAYTTKFGAPTVDSGTGPGLGSRTSSLNTTGDGFTWTATCSKAFIDTWPYAGSTGGIDWSVDGGAVTTQAVPSLANTNTFVTDTGITVDASHTIKAIKSATGNGVGLHGIRVYRDEYTKGFQVYESGRSGYTAELTKSHGWYDNMRAAQGNFPCQLAIIAFGTNEQSQAETTATFKSGLTGHIAAARSAAPGIAILLLMYPSRGDNATFKSGYPDYVTAAYEVAAADTGGTSGASGVALLDMTKILTGGAELSPTTPIDPLGFYDTDRLHPNATGHDIIAEYVELALAA